MKRTGVFATDEEAKELREMALEADLVARTPLRLLSLEMPDFTSPAWDGVRKHCHNVALSHGLPKILGYYGMNTEGEFIEAE